MQLEIGTILEGKVTGITNFGAFVELPQGKKGMVHISEVSTSFVKDIKDHLKVGDSVKVKVININEKGEVALSIKKAMDNDKSVRRNSEHKTFKRPSGGPGSFEWKGNKKSPEPTSFEDMMTMFKHTSEEKISDLKKATESKRGNFSRRGTQR